MIPVSFGVALSMFTMCAVLVYFLNYSKSNFCWPPLWFELYSQGPKSLVAHSIFYGFFSGACRCIFIHKSASYTEAHRDSGLSLMITALSSLATKEEEMGWVFFLFLSFPSFFQSTSVMVLITWFCLCQHPSGSGFDWKQLFCPFLVRFTRCSAWNKIQLGRTKFFLRGKYFKPIGSFVSHLSSSLL